MPIQNGKYVNPGWVNDTAPAMNATEMNAISDTLAKLPIENGGTNGTTVAEARNNLGLGNTSGALPIANGGTGANTAQDARTNLGFNATGGLVPITLGGTGANTAQQARINLGFTGNGGTVPISMGGTGATTVEQARINLGFTGSGGIVPISMGGTGATTAKQARINLGFDGANGIVPISMGGTGATGIESGSSVDCTFEKWGRMVVAHFRASVAAWNFNGVIPSAYAPKTNFHFTCPIYASASANGSNFKTGYATVFLRTNGDYTVQVAGTSTDSYPRFDIMYLV